MAKHPSQSKKASKKNFFDTEEQEEVASELEQVTDDIEAEKERKKFEREEKKFLKEHSKKRKQQERWVAPILFILTILISYIIFVLSTL